MPRLPHSLLLKARKISRLLPSILQTTRTLQSAINELRWLTEHVMETTQPRECPMQSRSRLLKLVRRRARGEPLQYILGSQPFGHLDIKCKKGVLIPRPETEAYVDHLITLLKKGKLHNWIKCKPLKQVSSTRKSALRILDACSGSGCISLLAYSRLRLIFPRFSVVGMDISQEAVDLANENIERNKKHLYIPDPKRNLGVSFIRRDIFEPFPPCMYDIIISNPPYISPAELDTDTERSVRKWEPRSALVPNVPSHHIPGMPSPQDIFYGRLMELHHESFSKVLLMEVGDASQAVRVLQQALKTKSIVENNEFQIWRDNPSSLPDKDATKYILLDKLTIPIVGVGKVRAVVLLRTRNFVPKNKEAYFIRRLTPTPQGVLLEPKSPPKVRKYTLSEAQRALKKREDPKPETYFFEESEIPELPDKLPRLERRKQRNPPLGQDIVPDPRPKVSWALAQKRKEKSLRKIDFIENRESPDVKKMLKPMISGWKESTRRKMGDWADRHFAPSWKFRDDVGPPGTKLFEMYDAGDRALKQPNKR